ncbi:tetratricopeptide repeat protein [Candidatus Roizmanbacteria bacterium]|nr:tetratricopeptide repeat protein [Candidatus Roizmanbacteria bacterium]
MSHPASILRKIRSYLIAALIFLFPLFFLPSTQEYFTTNKFYLVGFSSLLLFVLLALELVLGRKITWKKLPFDAGVTLIVVASGISILAASPNKIDALFTPILGTGALLGLAVWYFFISREKTNFLSVIRLSAVVISVVSILPLIPAFRSLPLPFYLQFLKRPAFSPLGQPLDLLVFLGFVIALEVSSFLTKHAGETVRGKMLRLARLTLFLVTIALMIYTVTKTGSSSSLLLPPVKQSWFAAVELLKSPVNALVGNGVGNFSAIFTKAKDITYNQSPIYWQINTFTVSRSAALHIFSETGLLGLASFALLFISLGYKTRFSFKNPFSLLTLYLLAVMLILPPSYVMITLFFLLLGITGTSHTEDETAPPTQLDFKDVTPFYIGISLVIFILVGAAGFFLARSYLGEWYFKKAIDAVGQNNLQDLYNNQRQAAIINPYSERFRINFAQTNLLIANNIATRLAEEQKNPKTTTDLLNQDRQIISQAINSAIQEAKAAVALNPQKSTNWENLAFVYRSVLNLAQGADVWTVAAYQRAIFIDPQNPVYRLSLGGIYYTLGSFDDAIRLFEQAVALKNDWANAHYNLAWAAFQKSDFQRAATEMQNVLLLLNPQKDQGDYARAQKDLADFKKKLPNEQPAAENQTPKALTLPTPPANKVIPKIALPKEASLEAQ